MESDQRAVTSDGGAALTTFFVGACVAVFPGVFRTWQRGHRRWSGTSRVGIDDVDDGDLQLRDPADQVVSRERVISELKRMDPGVREVAESIVSGAVGPDCQSRVSDGFSIRLWKAIADRPAAVRPPRMAAGMLSPASQVSSPATPPHTRASRRISASRRVNSGAWGVDM
ncbi:hypothetical protein ADK67_14925 [Saccharothrix sp. NRRL B-16348]|nr:hypothetical protein ADK67_14925 [Saccharothrix sp. NRRL B-16348]